MRPRFCYINLLFHFLEVRTGCSHNISRLPESVKFIADRCIRTIDDDVTIAGLLIDAAFIRANNDAVLLCDGVAWSEVRN